MLNLIRQISNVFPRSNRAWRSQADSDSPQIARKRRRSSTTEPDETLTVKKAKAEQDDTAASESPTRDQSPNRASTAETEQVKEVTKGVNEVELDDKGRPMTSTLPETSETEKIALEGETTENPAATTVDLEPPATVEPGSRDISPPLLDDTTSNHPSSPTTTPP